MQLVVALDMPTKAENIKLVKSLESYDGLWLKVGFRAYIRDGKEFLEEIKQINSTFNIFLDLKLYDIPNTMADAAQEIASLPIEMFNLHASAGEVAMRAVMDRLSGLTTRPMVFAVTALTSFDNSNFMKIYGDDIASKADEFAISAYASGLDGVVCSAHESISIKNATDQGFLTLTPGIRPFGEEASDQQRVATLELASAQLVDFPVIGRPIYQDSAPSDKVAKILHHISTL